MDGDDEIEVGDRVWLGGGKVHWIVLDLDYGTHSNILLKSGLTGRHKVIGEEMIDRLRIYSKGASR